MSVTLHIFFAGLLAFVASHDGGELSVLVPDAGHTHLLSDGSHLEAHRALLVARTAGCQGDCGAGDPEIAELLFADQPSEKRPAELADALRQGFAWELEGVELSISPQNPPLIIRPDFSAVADLDRIVPGKGAVDPALLSPQPPAGRLAARLRLQSGEVSTYRLVQVQGAVPSLHFRTLKDCRDAAPGYMQPLAAWVMAEIRVPGDTVEVVALGQGAKHSAKLSPDGHGVIDLVLMNVPVIRSNEEPGGPGRHFELYYDMLKERPARRPVPFVADLSAGQLPDERKRKEYRSELLAALRLDDPRGVYDRLICPPAQLNDGGEP